MQDILGPLYLLPTPCCSLVSMLRPVLSKPCISISPSIAILYPSSYCLLILCSPPSTMFTSLILLLCLLLLLPLCSSRPWRISGFIWVGHTKGAVHDVGCRGKDQVVAGVSKDQEEYSIQRNELMVSSTLIWRCYGWFKNMIWLV